jgi:hypothetical protein
MDSNEAPAVRGMAVQQHRTARQEVLGASLPTMGTHFSARVTVFRHRGLLF